MADSEEIYKITYDISNTVKNIDGELLGSIRNINGAVRETQQTSRALSTLDYLAGAFGTAAALRTKEVVDEVAKPQPGNSESTKSGKKSGQLPPLWMNSESQGDEKSILRQKINELEVDIGQLTRQKILDNKILDAAVMKTQSDGILIGDLYGQINALRERILVMSLEGETQLMPGTTKLGQLVSNGKNMSIPKGKANIKNQERLQ